MNKAEMKYLNPGEVKLFLEAAKDDRYYAAFLLAIETGMRPEEYLATQWKDLDFDKGVVTVRRVLITRTGGASISQNQRPRKADEAYQFQRPRLRRSKSIEERSSKKGWS
jgi:integrase